MGRTEVKWPWSERNQVFEGEGAEIALCSSPLPKLPHSLHRNVHTQHNDWSLKRGLLLEKDLFSLEKDSVKSVMGKPGY